jgi:hypothetical protein
MPKNAKRKFRELFNAYYNRRYLVKVKDTPDWSPPENKVIPMGVQGSDVTAFGKSC